MNMRKQSTISIIGIPEETTERIRQKQYLKKELPKLYNITKSQIEKALSKIQANNTNNNNSKHIIRHRLFELLNNKDKNILKGAKEKGTLLERRNNKADS